MSASKPLPQRDPAAALMKYTDEKRKQMEANATARLLRALRDAGGTEIPEGWSVVAKQRETGMSRGDIDYFFFGPDGKRYRSQKEAVSLMLEGPAIKEENTSDNDKTDKSAGGLRQTGARTSAASAEPSKGQAPASGKAAAATSNKPATAPSSKPAVGQSSRPTAVANSSKPSAVANAGKPAERRAQPTPPVAVPSRPGSTAPSRPSAAAAPAASPADTPAIEAKRKRAREAERERRKRRKLAAAEANGKSAPTAPGTTPAPRCNNPPSARPASSDMSDCSFSLGSKMSHLFKELDSESDTEINDYGQCMLAWRLSRAAQRHQLAQFGSASLDVLAAAAAGGEQQLPAGAEAATATPAAAAGQAVEHLTGGNGSVMEQESKGCSMGNAQLDAPCAPCGQSEMDVDEPARVTSQASDDQSLQAARHGTADVQQGLVLPGGGAGPPTGTDSDLKGSLQEPVAIVIRDKQDGVGVPDACELEAEQGAGTGKDAGAKVGETGNAFLTAGDDKDAVMAGDGQPECPPATACAAATDGSNGHAIDADASPPAAPVPESGWAGGPSGPAASVDHHAGTEGGEDSPRKRAGSSQRQDSLAPSLGEMGVWEDGVYVPAKRKTRAQARSERGDAPPPPKSAGRQGSVGKEAGLAPASKQTATQDEAAAGTEGPAAEQAPGKAKAVEQEQEFDEEEAALILAEGLAVAARRRRLRTHEVVQRHASELLLSAAPAMMRMIKVVEGLQAAGVAGNLFDEYTKAVRRVKGAAKLLAGVPHVAALPGNGQ